MAYSACADAALRQTNGLSKSTEHVCTRRDCCKSDKNGIERVTAFAGRTKKREVWEPIEMREKDGAGA
jgi:hypothetical protein